MGPPWTEIYRRGLMIVAGLLLLLCFLHVSGHSTPVRLVGNRYGYSLLEVYHNGEWGTVCDDFATDSLAKVVCRQLGYTGNVGSIRGSAYGGAGTGHIWLNDVKCTGTEVALDNCSFSYWGIQGCLHSEDISVSCLDLVTGIRPSSGSLQGGTHITLQGYGFSTNQFNHFPGTEHLGNKVFFVNTHFVYPCDVIPEKTDTSHIVCVTRSGMEPDTYDVKVTVDGKDIFVPTNIRFQPDSSATPTITSISPSSGPAGILLTLRGSTLGSKYGLNANLNGNNNKISRVNVGGGECHLMSPEGQIYGIASNYMKCKMSALGSKIGNINASFTLLPYGRSKVDLGLLKVSRNGQIFMFQSYAEVHSISPSSGSTEGGTLLTITGKSFDETRTKAVVKVGGTICDVIHLNDTSIICRTGRKPSSSQEMFPGNRGIAVESWTGTVRDLDKIRTLNESSPGYQMTISDTTHIPRNDYYGNNRRLKGFFVPPFDGKYEFFLSPIGPYKLYLMDNLLSSQSSGSKTISLHSNQSYYMELIYWQTGFSASFANLAVRYLDSIVNHHMAGNVQQEEQEIRILSDPIKEKQTISITDITTGSVVHEVQEIIIQGRVPASFRLGMYAVYTELILVGATAEDIENALQAIPVFDTSETVSVNRSSFGDGFKYIVKFISERGNFPELEVKKVSGAVSVKINTTRDGKPSGRKLALMMSGVPAPLIDINASREEILEAVEELFNSSCPSYWTSPKHTFLYEDFEERSPSFMGGSRQNRYEAFCGSWVLFNPTYLHYGKYIYLDVNPWLCMAFKGNIHYVYMEFLYTDEDEKISTSHSFYDLVISSNINQWHYDCYNLKNAITKIISDAENIILRSFQIVRSGNVLIDTVYIGRGATVEDKGDVHLRRLSYLPNGYKITDVDVTKHENDIDVILTTVPGGHDFPLFSVDHTQLTPDTNISVTRKEAASPPLGGFFDLTLRGQTFKSIPVGVGLSEMTAILLGFKDIGLVVMTYYYHTEIEKLWRFRFDTFPGNLEQIQINSSYVSGDNVWQYVSTIHEGQYTIDPLYGEMLQTAHDTPQVTVTINDVPSKCSGDCSYEWLPSNTPVVVNASRTHEPPYSEVQISGSGFSNIPNNNNVTIAGTQCNVTMATNDSITCDIDNVPAGEHNAVVDVLGSGIAKQEENNITLSFTTAIDNIRPVSCGLGGFVTLTISGSGFNEHSSVTVGTKVCERLSVNTTTITCLVPYMKEAESLNVAIIQSGEPPVTADTNFTYNDSLTPHVTDIFSNNTGVSGGGALTIHGRGFQAVGNVTLLVGQTVANITFYNDTYVVAELPPCSPGSHDVRVIVGDHGAAVNLENDIPDITCNLELNSIQPRSGSLFGGTVLTIEGRGFTNESKVKVGSHNCDVTTANDSLIICQIARTRKIHRVNNHGLHPSFGKYYSWSPQYVSIQVGDVVQWDWDFPFYITTMKPRVEETYNMTAKIGKPGGFSSGDVGTTKGSYTHEFNKAGTFYYWSGIIDVYSTTWFHGSIEVLDRTSFQAEVSVTQGDYEAKHNFLNSTSYPEAAIISDSPVHKQNCSDPLPVKSANNTNLQFAFWTCASPVINQISRQNGTTNDDIVISGNGFSDVSYHNNVTFGDYRCKVSNSSVSTVTCNIDPGNKPRVGRPQYIDVYVTDLGYAHINIDVNMLKTFALFPVITSINPSNGSLGGNTLLTVSGTGFEEGPDQIMTEITIGGYSCNIVSSIYTEIICLTPMYFVDNQLEVSVSIPVSGNINIPAKCDTSCQFTYNDLLTPKLTGVSPDTITGENATRIFITGTGFGNDLHTVSVIMKSSETHDCLVENVSDSEIVCSIISLPQGPNEVVVDIAPIGIAVDTNGSITVNSIPTVFDVVPSEGSLYGGTDITIVGNGFLSNTTVYIAGTPCTMKNRTVNTVVFTTEANYTIDTAVIEILSGAIWYPNQTFNFSEEVSPTVMSVQPSTGTKGENITIIGNNFGSSINETRVVIGDNDCIILSVNDTEITCTVGANRAGTYGLYVHVKGYGNSNNDQVFTFNMSIQAIEPSAGSLGGQQTVTILGAGFDEDTVVNICGNICNRSEDNVSTSTAHICDTPPWTESLSSKCDVTVTVNNVTKVLMNSYTYDPALTPVIDDVTPTRGGTQGGTRLTISGSNFGLTPSSTPGCNSSVTIAGTLCYITSWSNTTVVCVTEAHSKSERATVRVEVGCNGKADEDNAKFHFVDVWSSVYTWGGKELGLPTAGDIVVIQKGQTIMFDTDTPLLKMLLIQGGELVFDEKDVELKAENILITDGGHLQVGTEDEPFQHKAIITLYGHHRSKELPIYGTKSLAVREGTLDLHGMHKNITWTRLASSVNSGDINITLQHEVSWQPGDQIVISTTGGANSQSESEFKTIASIDADNKTIILASPLSHSHLGFTTDVAGREVDFSAEVGLLTHNVVIRGHSDPQWEEKIEACPDGFDPGYQATQTCTQGRYGAEMGSDQFGAQVVIHTTDPIKQLTTSRIEFVEFTHVGQAFRLSRHPINFHVTGDMSRSYVRGCGIHHTFNRAINIRDTYNLIVERNVIYDVNGAAIYLEDGTETGNVFQYNLGVFVKGSSQLLNDDISPATFWITNPNNTFRHNSAVGGTHFGYWIRLEDVVQSVVTGTHRPRYTPLAEFNDNTAHSLGWHGVWIYPIYTPRIMYSYNSISSPQPAMFDNINVWNCRKGVEVENMGAVKIRGLVAVNNIEAGYEGKLIIEGNQYTDDSPAVGDSVIAGYLPGIPSQGCTTGGVISPYKFGFTIRYVTFVNFNQTNCFALRITRITDQCSSNCGGFMYRTSNLTFINADNRVNNDWIWESVFEDMDGSLCGSANCKVVPCTGTLPSNCTSFTNSSSIPLCSCPTEVRLIRSIIMSYMYSNDYSNIHYTSASPIIFTNQYGSTPHQYRRKAIDPSYGWMTNVVSGESYYWDVDTSEVRTYLAYYCNFYRLQYGDYFIISHAFAGEPDEISIDGNNQINAINETFDPEVHYHGDWHYNKTSGLISYLVSYKRRGYSSYGIHDISYNLRIRKCFHKGCVTPTTTPTPTTPCVYWSSPSSWPNNTLPVDGDDVTISKDVCMIADTTIPSLNKLVIYGVLEFDHGPVNGSYRNFTLNVTDIIIIGGDLHIGSPNDTFKGDMDIILRGRRSTDHESEEHLPNTDIPINAKSIAVYGGLEIHGKDVGVPWTKLHTTVNPGDTTITLAENVTWAAGDEIVIAPTSYDIWETETFRITDVLNDGVTLSLNASLRFRHIAYNEEIGGRSVQMAAEVGLLTRNIRVVADNDESLLKEGYGGRVVVGATSFGNELHKGNARFSNVEFVHTGLTYTNAERVTDHKPSAVTNCAFHHVLSKAIGVYGTTGVVLNDNVIYHSVSSAIKTSARRTTIARNLIVLVSEDITNDLGAVCTEHSRELTLVGNTVSGAYRVAYRLPGEERGFSSTSSGNEAHSSSVGLDVYYMDSSYSSCNEISNFFIWKCSNVGIHYNGQQSVDIHGVILAENILGIYAQVTGPNPVDHLYSPKFCMIRDSLIIGRTPSYNCTTDKCTKLSHQLTGGHVGVTFTSFMQYRSGYSLYDMLPSNSYPAIMGVTKVQDVTFTHFKTVCGTKDVMITTNKWNDDGQHPVETIRITKYNSDNDSYFFIHRPNIEKVNPSACVDMDCDGLKKALIKDKDGSFLGTRGAVLSQSEWEWDGDPRRGLGDYRIPRELLTTVTGERINVSTIAPHKGIIRNDSCHFRSDWQAYECHDLDYEMLIIESLDADTETRRLSPVAILGDGYIDLINGPQDHSGCSQGYCRKRLSTFMAIVATGKTYSLYFSTTSPQTLRLFLLNSDNSQRIILAIWYSQSNRRDVYIGDDVVLAKNARMVDEKYIVDRPTRPGEFNPHLDDVIGANFFDRDSNTLYVLVSGDTPVKIVTNPSLIVSFQIPALTPEEFYGEALVRNLALFFDVPPEKVRIVNVVREAGRKRRATDGSTIEVVTEVGDGPSAGGNATVNETLTKDELLNKSAMFINTVQGGVDISQALNVTITGSFVSEPVDPELASPRADTSGKITVPKTLNISVHLNSSYETAQFPIQPCLHVIDEQDEPMKKLGSIGDPWRITAYLRSGTHQSVQLHGTTSVEVISGWANFTNLSLSHYGDDYSIVFNKSYPDNAIDLTVLSEKFSVNKISLGLNIITEDITLVNNETRVMIELLDDMTKDRIRNIAWRGHTWTATVNLDESLDGISGNMSGSKQATFDPLTGDVVFDNLVFEQIGVYFLRFNVKSSPTEYDLSGQIQVHVLSEVQLSLRNDNTATSTNFSLTFNENYTDIVGDDAKGFEAMIINRLARENPDVYFNIISVRPGSIDVDGNLSQKSNNINTTLHSMAHSFSRKSFTYKKHKLRRPRLRSGRGYITSPPQSTEDSTSSPTTTTAETSTSAQATTTNSILSSTGTASSAPNSQLPLASVVAIVTAPVATLFGIIFIIIICKCRKIREREKSEYLTKTSTADSDDIDGRKRESIHGGHAYLSPIGLTNDLKPQQCNIPRIQTNLEKRPFTPTFEIEHHLAPSSMGSFRSAGSNNWRRPYIRGATEPSDSDEMLSSLSFYTGKRK